MGWDSQWIGWHLEQPKTLLPTYDSVENYVLGREQGFTELYGWLILDINLAWKAMYWA